VRPGWTILGTRKHSLIPIFSSEFVWVHADLTIKEKILCRAAPIQARAGRYQSDDDLLAFLKGR
jgi:hypothetical protein